MKPPELVKDWVRLAEHNDRLADQSRGGDRQERRVRAETLRWCARQLHRGIDEALSDGAIQSEGVAQRYTIDDDTMLPGGRR